MKLMRVFLTIIFAWSILFIVVPAYAQTNLCPRGNFANLCIEASSTGKIVSNVIQLLMTIGLVLAVIFLIWGGIKWLMAGGDKGKLEESRSTITAAVIGIILIFVTFFIFNFILFLFGISTTKPFPIPRLTD